MTKTFEDFGLTPLLAKSLTYMNYSEPTPIQSQAIPIAMQGHDIMGSAQTGTGKTAAFAIPLVEHLMNNPNSCGLVLTPTRELGKQVMDVIKQLIGPRGNIKTAFIIGGDPYKRQMNQLNQNPRLVVGTPGRVIDHLKRRTLKLDDTDFLVLDETDRMLDMGFSIQLDEIVEFLPDQRQTLMFSATLPKNIINLSQKYLNNPKRVSVGSTTAPALNIKQEVIRVDEGAKYNELLTQLHEREGTIVIFAKTKRNTERLAKRLSDDDFSTDAIHGDLKQSKRERVIRAYREKKFRILVATDVVARGLDIPHIQHVINYDLPQVPEDYIHRIGRTARAGASGSSLSLLTPKDGRLWHAIECLIDPDKKPANDSGSGYGKPRKGKYSKDRKFGKPRGEGENSSKRHSSRPTYKKDEQRGDRNRDDNRQGAREDRRPSNRDDNRFDKPRGEKRFDKPRGEQRADGDNKQHGNKRSNDWSQKKRDDNRSDRPRDEKRFDKRSENRDDRPRGAKPHSERRDDRRDDRRDNRRGNEAQQESRGNYQKKGQGENRFDSRPGQASAKKPHRKGAASYAPASLGGDQPLTRKKPKHNGGGKAFAKTKNGSPSKFNKGKPNAGKRPHAQGGDAPKKPHKAA